MQPRNMHGAFVILVAIVLTNCAGANKDVIAKQREGVGYQVPYQTALQTTLFTLTKKGIAINFIDRENGFITTLPQQIREERYFYQIAIRPIGPSETIITVVCNWSVTPGIDIAFIGLPSAVARSKSSDLEIELAEDIRKEIAKVQTK